MGRFLYRSGSLLSANEYRGVESTTRASRKCSTPVLTVVYDDEEGIDPKIQYLCMKTFTPDGGRLPQHSLSEDETSTASSDSYRMGAVAIVDIVGLVLLLQ